MKILNLKALEIITSPKESTNLGSLKKKYLALREIMPKDHPGDMPWNEWLQIYGLCKAFNPNCVFEFGRGYGNSTLVFDSCLTNNQPLYSICITDYSETQRGLAQKNIKLRKDTKILHSNIIDFPFKRIARKHRDQKVMVFWDAHGFEVAEEILARFLPELNGEVLVLMHDIGDLRFQKSFREFGSQSIWKAEPEKWPGPSVVVGHFFAHVAQLVSITDFCSRNKIELFSQSFSNSESLKSLNRKKAKILSKLQFVSRNGLASFLFKKNNKTTFPVKKNRSKCGMKSIKSIVKDLPETTKHDSLPRKSLMQKILSLAAKIRRAHNDH